jgi:hypothetical protein
MDQQMARALTDAGYMSVAEYLRLCVANGWQSGRKANHSVLAFDSIIDP